MVGLEVGSPVIEKQTQPVVIGPGVAVGGQEVILMAGPCAVESYEQTRLAAEAVRQVGGRVLRGEAFKPRSSPHSFQGLGRAGLVLPAARAAVAAGADGLLVEIHPYPSQALSDAEQALPLAALPQLVKEVRQISRAMGRTLL